MGGYWGRELGNVGGDSKLFYFLLGVYTVLIPLLAAGLVDQFLLGNNICATC